MNLPDFPAQIDFVRTLAGPIAVAVGSFVVCVAVAWGSRGAAGMGQRSAWARACAFCLTVLMISVAALQSASIWRSGVRVEADALVLQGAQAKRFAATRIYGRRARLIDLDERPAFEISRTVRATRQPGFVSGWVKLNNGMLAYALMGTARKVVIVPTANGLALMLGVQDPEALLERLQNWDAASQSDAL